LIVELRPVEYPRRYGAQRLGRRGHARDCPFPKGLVDERGAARGKDPGVRCACVDPGGAGLEIAREVIACAACAARVRPPRLDLPAPRPVTRAA
jgi:hypothetical protein